MIYLNLNANILLNTSIVLIIGDIFFIFVLRYDLSTIFRKGPYLRIFFSFNGNNKLFPRKKEDIKLQTNIAIKR